LLKSEKILKSRQIKNDIILSTQPRFSDWLYTLEHTLLDADTAKLKNPKALSNFQTHNYIDTLRHGTFLDEIALNSSVLPERNYRT
jgi:hypothetical protein